ncbi:MAG: molecular chaperone TorD family protein [Rubrivivax sp.]
MARAELYGLLAQLWLAPPDAALRRQLAVAVTQAPQPGARLEAAWQDLVGALRARDADALQEEYDALFGGVGKSEIFPYGSFYLSGHLHEQPLATLRGDLNALGLTRDRERAETEDHVSYLFEVMRFLIAGDDAGTCNLEQQRRFFRTHVQPWVETLCDTVLAHPAAHATAALAALTRDFIQVETQGFDLLEA